MKWIKKRLSHLFVVSGLMILPLFGMSMTDYSSSDPEGVIRPEGEIETTTEAQVNSAGMRVRSYRGGRSYYRSYSYPRDSYYRRYHNKRGRHPRYNYRYYYYDHYRPYGPVYNGS